MTSILEKAISIIAPHHCISCGKQNNILCDTCFADVFDEPCEVCFLCGQPTVEARVCHHCRPQTAIGHVWMCGTYEGLRRQLIRAYKFERLRAAHQPLAAAMDHILPYLEDVVVVPLPTAPLRVRVRGYDQTLLLARELARRRQWELAVPLRRRHNLRQVGANKAKRAAQAATAYELVASSAVQGKHVLLVDDVTTSGATLAVAADMLAEAGARRIDAVVVAKHTL